MAQRKPSVNLAVLERMLRVFTKNGVNLLRTELTPDGKVVMFHSAASDVEEIAAPDQAFAEWQKKRVAPK
jgi:hypothetical protein